MLDFGSIDKFPSVASACFFPKLFELTIRWRGFTPETALLHLLISTKFLLQSSDRVLVLETGMCISSETPSKEVNTDFVSAI